MKILGLNSLLVNKNNEEKIMKMGDSRKIGILKIKGNMQTVSRIGYKRTFVSSDRYGVSLPKALVSWRQFQMRILF